MTIIKTIEELKAYRQKLKENIGFVPTMGALHAGHLSLIQQSIKDNKHTIVSVFVNPTQFLEGEDMATYPRQEKTDLEICSRAGVDAVFMPDALTMYADDEPSIKAPKVSGFILEGQERAGHFDGVLTVVLKLLNLTRPDKAYFGKKDAQQLFLVQNMVKSFHLPCKIIPCEIVRSSDGLALSSRNAYLSKDEKQEALKLSSALQKASQMIMQNELNSSKIKKQMLQTLKPLKVDYVQIVSRGFEPLSKVKIKNTIILVAAHVGKARLIDNVWI